MQALMSLLPESYSLQVAQIWNMLEEQFGLTYIKITPIPHFTWQLGEGYRDETVPAERRIYFEAGRAIRVIEDGKTRDKLSAADLRSAREVQSAAVKLRDVFNRTINL